MRITTNNHLYTKTPTFGTIMYRPAAFMEDGMRVGTQNSTGRRYDLSYDELAKLCESRFKKYNKINIMPMNVSDGTEAYYIADALIRRLGIEDFKKRVAPIIATDAYEPIIKEFGQKGEIGLCKEDLRFLKPDKYFNKIEGKSPDTTGIQVYKLKPEFHKLFQFDVMNFRDRIAQMSDNGNSVVIIRNCLREAYGTTVSQGILLDIIDRLHPNSLLVIGKEENLIELDKWLVEWGNMHRVGYNIFSKTSNIATFFKNFLKP